MSSHVLDGRYPQIRQRRCTRVSPACEWSPGYHQMSYSMKWDKSVQWFPRVVLISHLDGYCRNALNEYVIAWTNAIDDLLWEPRWGTSESSFPEYMIIFMLCAVAFLARSVKNVIGLVSFECMELTRYHSTYALPGRGSLHKPCIRKEEWDILGSPLV